MLSELLLIEIQRLSVNDKLPLHQQLHEALRCAMLDGKLSPGDRLPSSCQLSQDLHLSCNTVVAALSQLSVDGYLVSRVGSGTLVNRNIPASLTREQPPQAKSKRQATLSRRGRVLTNTLGASELQVQPFSPGIADFNAFPLAAWHRLQDKHRPWATPIGLTTATMAALRPGVALSPTAFAWPEACLWNPNRS